MAVAGVDDAYERGHRQGGVEEQIAEHGRRLDKINGSIADSARAMHELRLTMREEMHAQTLAIQRLADEATANAATVISTAKALKEAEAARRDRSTQSWTPFARIIAVLGGLAAIAAVAGLYLALIHR